MFGIGIPELILILIVGLIVFGPGKLPEVGRAVGRGIREFRKASSALQAVINEPDTPPKQPVQNQPQATPQQTAQTAPAQTQQPIQPNQAPPPQPVQTPQPQQQQPVQTAQAQSQDTPVPQQTDTGTTSAAQNPAAADIPYTPPTQESVRQELESKKEA